MKKDGKASGFLNEFKTFIMRGNVMDLAVGVIIGGAFQAIVKSLVDDVFMPIISLATKGIDFSNWFLALDGGDYATLEAAKAAGAATINFGSFISAVINFIIMAFIIFIFIKGINTLMERALPKKEEPAVEPTTKVCPYCQSEIDIKAVKCPHCTSEVE